MLNFIRGFYNIDRISKADQKYIEHLFARLFSSEEGKNAIAFLQYITFHRTLGSNAPDSQLRYHEGQRAIVTKIMNLIERGQKG